MTERLAQEMPADDAPSWARPSGEVQATMKDEVLYNTRTFEPVLINRNNVSDALAKTHDDPAFPAWKGKKLFTRGIFNEATKTYTKPGEYKVGHFLCYLNPEHPDREMYAKYTQTTCPARHIWSAEQVRMHMEHRHKSEWKSIKDAQEEEQRQADRLRQNLLMERLIRESAPTGAMTPQPAAVAVAEKPEAKAERTPAQIAAAERMKNARAAQIAKRKQKQEAPAE